MLPKDFFAKVGAPAAESAKKAKIFASVVLAQSALESGWGEKAPGNNLFGIRADKSWKGTTVDFPTHEVIKGVRTPCIGKFRAYPDWQGSFDDHAAFLLRNPRYLPVLAAKTPEDACTQLQKCGYSTDPNYAKTLISIITHHNLKQYDAK